MGWPPAVVIVVRHGARLDAADKQWHLTSPTPYDPPLTYGGWNQSKALGNRIANILRSRETDDEITTSEGDNQDGGDRRKRRHRVVIHSSPFLRCVQTSIGISAGLAQNPGHTVPRLHPNPSPSIKPMHQSPMMRPGTSTGSPRLAPIPEPALLLPHGKPYEQPDNIKKATIRVDAFLGEWLTPDYFEDITPPPSSVMMVAGAKADLLRREDYSDLVHTKELKAKANQPFPGGWGSPIVVAAKDKDEPALPDLSALVTALPGRDRTNSLSSVGSHGKRLARKTSIVNLAGEHGIYQPPVPIYAVSSGETIPSGYTAHARDACVNVDYQWDSMREPQNWGNGGEYGEEWTSMHRRFRGGLSSLLAWYSNTHEPAKLLTRTQSSERLLKLGDNLDDDDTDLVIILVTHGAGCNALIGALTNQPVLIDVGMASLTMAVRKTSAVNSPTSSPITTPGHSRVSSRNVAVSDQYDVKLIANTEHLMTSASSTPSQSRAPSLAGLPNFKERYNSFDGSSLSIPRTPPTSGNFGSIRRTATIAGMGSRTYVPARQHSIGLWSPAPQQADEIADEEPEDDIILNFRNIEPEVIKQEPPAVNENTRAAVFETEEQKEEEPFEEVAPLGLWGGPRPPAYGEMIREIAPKRRWTVNERG